MPIFSGLAKDWPAFQACLIEYLRNRTPKFRFGMTWDVIPLDLYNLQFNPGEAIVAHVPVVDPGPAPADLADDATQIQIARWNAANTAHNQLKTSFEEIQQLQMSIKRTILRITPKDALDQISDPIHGMLRVTSAAWFIEMRRIYGTLSTKDLEDNLKELEAEWDPLTPLASLVAKHLRSHNVQEANGQGLRMLDKVKYFTKSVQPAGFLNNRIESWLTEFPAHAQQTFVGADGISTALIEFERNASRNFSTKAAGYVNATIGPVSALTKLEIENNSLKEQLAAAVNAQPAIKNNVNHKKQRGSGAGGGGKVPGPPPQVYYCWSHGYCGHPGTGPPPPLGIGCSNRKPGHDENATWRNKNGGSTNC